MDWKFLDDPENIENRNAGNGGDLVKHTVYLALLRFLLSRQPWRDELVLRECHAGRGIYRIPAGDPRNRLLNCLWSDPTVGSEVLLYGAQRSVLGGLGCWQNQQNGFHCYAGSALINASALAENQLGSHRLELYEWQPETRQILGSVLADSGIERQVSVNLLSADLKDETFDGEAYVEAQIGQWGRQNVLFLDPFAMWRQPGDQGSRNRYGAIVDSLIRRGLDAPSLVLFWTWGRAFPIAEGDLDGSGEPVKNGYHELRGRLHSAGFHFIRVKWRWGLQFAMWIVVPGEHLTMLREDLDMHCSALSHHLVRQGCRESLSHPSVEVSID